eukprot:91599_1
MSRLFIRYRPDSSNPFRCMMQLSNDHLRIRVTLQSFNRFLVPILPFNNQFIIDLSKYIQFISNYVALHHKKESILYEKAIKRMNKSSDKKVIANITYMRDEIIDRKKSIIELQNIVYGATSALTNNNNGYPFDNMIETANDYIKKEIEHLDQSKHAMYPIIIAHLDPKDLNEVSHLFDKMTEKHKESITESEQLSDTLLHIYI